MFDRVAHRYDFMNDIMTGGLHRQWCRETVAAVHPQPGELILDLAAGTGFSSQPLADSGAMVVPVDLSFGMVFEGRQRHPNLPFINADACNLPFADDTFDAVTISYGIRNVQHTDRVLAEMRRVTKPGGRLVVLEFSTPTSTKFKKIYKQYLLKGIPATAGKVSSNPEAYEYLAESIIDWPDQKTFADLMVNAGWNQVAWKNLLGGIAALHRGHA